MTYPLKHVEHDGLLGPPAPMVLPKDGKITPQMIVSINQTLAAIVRHINSGLSVGTAQPGSAVGNFQNQWLSFVTPSTADEEFELPHGLGRVPIGFTTWFMSQPAIVYVSNYGSWNKERLLLKCSGTAASVIIELA